MSPHDCSSCIDNVVLGPLSNLSVYTLQNNCQRNKMTETYGQELHACHLVFGTY